MGVRDKIVKAITEKMGIKAYHSSPHDFDRFDLSKIGTGEGAQVYGHGLYFAENPAVSGQGGQYWNQFSNKFRGPEGSAANLMKLNAFDREAAIEQARRALAKEQETLRTGHYVPGDPATKMDADQLSWHPALIEKQQEVLRLLESGAPVGPRTYEVNIKADPAQMLDWDKPFTQQSPQVQSILRDDLYLAPTSKETGRELYRQAYPLIDDLDKGRVRATERLREAGIPGIKYLDEGSRNAQPILKTDRAGNVISSEYPAQTSNYVIFDPANIDIVKKYGVVGAPAGTLGMGALADQNRYEVSQ